MFFNKEEIQSIAIQERHEQFKKPKETTCIDCGLFKSCLSPKMEPHGKGKKGIYLLGMCPGAQEDEKNNQFVGQSGQYLRDALESFDIDIDEDCYKDNANRCRAITASQYGNETNRDPTAREISICRPKILKSIEELQPKKIILFGANAVTSLLGHRTSDIGKIGKWVGWKIPDQDLKCWIYPNYHPSFPMRDEFNIPANKLFKEYLGEALTHNEPFPDYSNLEKHVHIITDIKDVISLLRSLLVKRGTIAFDYETTGLKPHKKGHKILCMSISCNYFESYSFPFFEDKTFQELIKEILTHPKIKKTVYNLKFESIWTYFISGYDVCNWTTDPMINAHIIDNRRMITSLKFQSYINFGIIGYDREIKKYMTAEKGGNNFNKLEKVPLKKLLLYCGLDSMLTYLLWHKQRRIMTEWSSNRKKAIHLFKESISSFCDIEKNGFNIISKYYLEQDEHLSRRLERLLCKINDSKEIALWKQHNKGEFNPRSPDHLRDVFFKYLKHPSKKLTDSGLDSTDKEVLVDLNTEFSNLILEYKKYYKIKNTYLSGFLREMLDDKLYPNNNLNITRTFRSSVNSPNYQNIPNREEEAKKITRRGIVPRPRHVILGVDYGAVEVRIGACYHKDPAMITYCKDPSTDMHRDCYSFDTKILTEDGFKFYDDIEDDEKIAQYNPNMDRIEYVNFIKRVCYNYIGDMYHIRNRHIDVFVTPTHRLYLKKIHNYFKIIKAEDVKRYSYYIKTGADIIDMIEPPIFYFKPTFGTNRNRTKKYHDSFTIKTDDMFELLGYLITDGHFKYHKQGAYRINLSQTKEPYRSKIKLCIDRIKSYTDFKFHEETDKWSMSNKIFCSWLFDNFGINKINRKLPDFIKKAPINQLKTFFDACMLGDGSFNKGKKSGRLYTISTEFIEDFQFVCMRLGYSTNITKEKLRESRKVQLYRINIIFHSEIHIKISPNYFSKEKYNNKVFCFTVPSGLLITKRKNKISIQGNSATDIFCLPSDQITKNIRHAAKNAFVFPEFYGSYYMQCAPNLWKCVLEQSLDNGTSLRKHLIEKGITNYEEFEAHVADVEYNFWHKRFRTYTKWKEKIWKFYEKNLYIESLSGFRYTGLMKRNDVLNYAIQGDACHCLLWSMNKIHKYLKETNKDTYILGQIHDELLFDANPKELFEITPVIEKIMCKDVREYYPWIIVPLIVEMTATDIDGNWYGKEKIDYEAKIMH